METIASTPILLDKNEDIQMNDASDNHTRLLISLGKRERKSLTNDLAMFVYNQPLLPMFGNSKMKPSRVHATAPDGNFFFEQLLSF